MRTIQRDQTSLAIVQLICCDHLSSRTRTETFPGLTVRIISLRLLISSSLSAVVGPAARLDNIKAAAYCQKVAERRVDNFLSTFANKLQI